MNKLIISPNKSNLKTELKSIFKFRELLWILAWRDIKIRYAQTALGLIWAFINPIIQIIILSFVFGTIAKVGTNNLPVPHIIYTSAGMCGWVFFSKLLSGAGVSIINAQNMVQKIYFPRIILPLSKAFTGLIDFIIALLIVFILMLFYKVSISKSILFLPIFILLAIICGLGGGIWIAALTIKYRDFTHITPLLLRIGMYSTPIAYSAEVVPKQFSFIFFLNPLAGIVEGIRWSILGGPEPTNYSFISFSIAIILFVTGLLYFFKIQDDIADII